MVKNGCGQSDVWTLKLTVSEKWTGKIKRFFSCWHKFRKAKSWFNDLWVGVVKNGYGFLVHETLKSAVSSEWIYELWGDFLIADSDATIFGWTNIVFFDF